MKKLLFLAALFFGGNAIAQKAQPSVEANLPSYSCQDSMRLNKEKTIVELFGKAYFKTTSLEVKNADKIVFNSITKDVLVLGNFDLVMFESIKGIPGGDNKTLKFKLGESTAYVY